MISNASRASNGLTKLLPMFKEEVEEWLEEAVVKPEDEEGVRRG